MKEKEAREAQIAEKAIMRSREDVERREADLRLLRVAEEESRVRR
jgi:hypothetical protein